VLLTNLPSDSDACSNLTTTVLCICFNYIILYFYYIFYYHAFIEFICNIIIIIKLCVSSPKSINVMIKEFTIISSVPKHLEQWLACCMCSINFVE
jgi:hypothetical protein